MLVKRVQTAKLLYVVSKTAFSLTFEINSRDQKPLFPVPLPRASGVSRIELEAGHALGCGFFVTALEALRHRIHSDDVAHLEE